MARSYLNETNANTYSNFNATNNFAVDTFPEYQDLTAEEYVLVDELNLLAKKTNKTPTEIDRQNYLATLLESKTPRAIDYVKFASALINTQKQVRDSIVPYVESKKTEITNLTETKKTEINTVKDDTLTLIEQKKANIIEYMDTTTAGAIRNDIGVMGDSTVTGINLVEKTNSLKSAIDGKASGTDLTNLQSTVETSLGEIETDVLSLDSNKVNKNDYVSNNAFANTTGTSTAYTATLNPAPISYLDGMNIIVVPHVDCGITPTLNINSLGALTIVKQDGSAIASGDIKANKPLSLVRVGSNFFIRSSSGGSNIKSLQRGTATYTNKTSLDIAIALVDLTKSVVIIEMDISSSFSYLNVSAITAKLTSPTNLNLSSITSWGAVQYVNWTVIEFNNVKSIQIGTTSIANAGSSVNIPITGVNITKSLVFVSMKNDLSYDADPYTDRIIIGKLSSSTILNIARKSGNRGNATIDWQVIEFS